ncbi:pilus assembly protein TadE [Dactylosporangium vinaceum]|uniref:Rv3654c family TadE-like protein n=1 Tax=Dactylosporangium vinaceum TaxID=53362 RepID=A0ABV5MLW0_9ACTN|nr:Rv3654c family TadE-like protein [Dactylosporangium vinaceum]UAB96850.1 pilus assembly protein TadE [Dactylosporangium vinaceum]
MRSRERGSASLLCLGVGLALAALAFGFATAGGLIVARHRARNAADAGALAGAMAAWRGSAAACAAAGRLAAANGGRLTGCRLAGPVVTVTVEVLAGNGLKAAAGARAGPVRSVRGGPGEAVDLAEGDRGGG